MINKSIIDSQIDSCISSLIKEGKKKTESEEMFRNERDEAIRHVSLNIKTVIMSTTESYQGRMYNARTRHSTSVQDVSSFPTLPLEIYTFLIWSRQLAKISSNAFYIF